MSYEYFNARVHALKALLLKEEHYKELLEMDLAGLINFLAGTDYREEIEKSSVEYSGYELVEDALMRAGQRVFRKLFTIAPPGPQELLKIIFERWEVFNLKTVLRGKHASLEEKQILESLYPTIINEPAFYQELAAQKDIKTCIDYLFTVGNHYYKPLLKSYPEYEATKKLAILENALDSFYFGESRVALEAIGDYNAMLIRRSLGTEVDVLNLVYALRVVEEEVASEEKYKYILPGGERLSELFIKRLIDSRDKGEFFNKLAGNFYHQRLGEFEVLDLDAGDFQERLENFLFQERCRIDHSHPFDIHLAHAFIWRKFVEIVNLRVIASGLSRKAPREEIEARMILLS